MDRPNVSPIATNMVVAFTPLCHSAQTLRKFHDRGGTREQIENALRIMPFVRTPLENVRMLP